MYPVSEAYKTAMAADERTLRVKFDGGASYEFDGETVQSVKTTELCSSDKGITAGSCCCSSCEAVLLDKDGILEGKSFGDLEFTLRLGVRLDSGDYEDVPLGVFTVTEARRDGKKVSIKASDRMTRFDETITLTPDQGALRLDMRGGSRVLGAGYTLGELAEAAADLAGLSLKNSAFTNRAYVPGMPIEGELSARTLLSYIAQAAGGFARITRDGALEIGAYTPLPSTDLVDASGYFTASVAEYTAPTITKLNVQAEKGDVGRTVGTGDTAYAIVGNPLLYRLNDTDDYAVYMNPMLANISLAAYNPMELTTRGDPAIQAGDTVPVMTADGTSRTLPVMSHELSYNGGLRSLLVSTGAAPGDAKPQGVINEQVAALNRKTNRLERDNERNKLIIEDITTQVPYIGETPPENPDKGRLWQDVAEPPVLREWDGSQWVEAQGKTTVISSAIEQTKSRIHVEVAETYTTKAEADDMREDIQQQIVEESARIETTKDAILAEVSETYATGEDVEQKISASSELLSDSFTVRFNQLKESTDENAAGVDGAEKKFEEISKYMRYKDGILELGESSSPILLQHSNDRIRFVLSDGTEQSFWTSTSWELTNLLRFRVGPGALVVQDNGSISGIKAEV